MIRPKFHFDKCNHEELRLQFDDGLVCKCGHSHSDHDVITNHPYYEHRTHQPCFHFPESCKCKNWIMK